MFIPRILISIVLLVVVVVFGLGIIWPKYQDFKNLQLEIGNAKLEVKYKEEYFQDLRKTLEEFQNYQSNLKKIDSALPSELDFPNLFNFLQNLAAQNELILGSIASTLQPASKEKKIGEISLSLSLSGTYPDLKKFLVSLEKQAKLFETKSISFSTPEEGEIFDFSLNIETYTY